MDREPTYEKLEQKVKESDKQVFERKLAEETIMQTNNEWERTFDAVPDMLMILDDGYRIVRVNEAMADRLGVIPDEAVGLICYEHVHGTKEPPPFCPHSKLLADGQRHLMEVHEERLGGDFLVSVSPLHDMEGHLTGSVHVVRDITQQKKVERELRESGKRFRELAELLPQPIFEIDVEGLLTYANRSGFETFGYTPEDLEKGVHALQLFHQEEGERVEQNIRKLLSGVKFEDHEYIGLKKDGATFPLLLYTSPIIRDEKTVGVRGIVLDITERKRAEKALKVRGAELKKKTHNLEETNAALKVVLRQREQDKKELEEKVVSNVKEMVLPFVEKLNKKLPDDTLQVYLDIIKSHLEDITAPFTHQLFSKYSNLTPSEIKIAVLVKDGKTTKEIAELLDASTDTVSIHRKNLRKKLDLRNRKINLRAHLSSLT